MPESKIQKKVFTAGKQNRDFDPRLIRQGEYIRMVNGRIARSDAGDVGAVENVVGAAQVGSRSFLDSRAVVLGVAKRLDVVSIYFFVKGSEEDALVEYNENNNEIRFILRDTRGVLNFNSGALITGIDVVESPPYYDDVDKRFIPNVLR